jgi:signal transduction histidine kinase
MKTAIVDEAQDQAHHVQPPPTTHGYTEPTPPSYGGNHDKPPVGPGRAPYGSDSVFVSVLRRNLTCLSSTPGGPAGQWGNRIPDLSAARQALRAKRPELSTFAFDKVSYLTYTLPVTSSGQVVGVVQASADESQYQQSTEKILQVLVFVGGIGLLAALCISGVVVNRALLPIRSSLSRQRAFVADAAHELRTPISIIRSAGEMLLRDSGAEKREEMGQVAVEEANHLSRLVADLSLLARSDTGTMDFSMADVDYSQLLTNVTADIEVLADDGRVDLQREVAPGIRVHGDQMRLRQLILIVLDNALKHTPDGGAIQVHLDVVRKRARLRVVDTGPGIAPADLDHIFDRFYRSSESRTGEGTGLGLAIAESIARSHGGSISGANRTDRSGAIFTVLLPLAG